MFKVGDVVRGRSGLFYVIIADMRNEGRMRIRNRKGRTKDTHVSPSWYSLVGRNYKERKNV